MKNLSTLLFLFTFGLASFLNANNIWLLDDQDHWSLVLQQQVQNTTLIRVFEQQKSEPLNPKFVFKSQGKLHGVYREDGKIVFVFPKSIFSLDAEQNFKILHKAPKHHLFVGPVKEAGSKVWVLKDMKSGEFVSWNVADDEQKVISDLSVFKESAVLPWVSKSGHLFMAELALEEKDLEIALIKLVNSTLTVERQTFNDFQIGAFSEDREGLWLLPAEGTLGMQWNGKVFKPTQLRPLPEPYIRWLSRLNLGDETLYLSTKGLNLDLFLSSEQVALDLNQGVEVKSSEQDSLLEQMTLFFLLILSFVMFIQWRTKFHEQLVTKGGRDLVLEVRSAPLFLRGLAFWMDFYFVLLPLVFLYAHFYSDEFAALQNQSFMAMQMGSLEQSEVMVQRMNELFPLVIGLFIFLSIYHVLMEKYFGGSLGKLFFRIKVISLDGNPLTWKQTLLRAMTKTLDYNFIIFPPSLIFILTSSLNQSLGDRAAKTQVVTQIPR